MREGFLWGVATSAHQIEGARDLRGDSIWDRFSEIPGKIADGYRADVGCDHYHRWREDIQLMKELGINSTRFSVSWPRVEPREGVVGDLEFYDRLVDAYLEAGIDPMVNLFHWDFPLWAEDDGGWNDPRTPERFGRYAERVSQRLGDRVRSWITFNEPNCFIGDGLMGTVHAPGHGWDWTKGALALTRFFEMHQQAMAAIRVHSPGSAITVALAGTVWSPLVETERCIEAARARTFAQTSKNLWTFGLFSDALMGLPWQSDVLETIPELTELTCPDPLDFICLNLYSGGFVGEDGLPVTLPPGHPVSAFNWPITPEMMHWGPKFFAERYRKPVLIGENGMASHDWRSQNGEVEDYARADFIRRHLLELARAVNEGVDVMGYHHWTFLDNFEWQEGFRKRFGLVHVDFQSLARTPKHSFKVYRDLIRGSAESWNNENGPLARPRP